MNRDTYAKYEASVCIVSIGGPIPEGANIVTALKRLDYKGFPVVINDWLPTGIVQKLVAGDDVEDRYLPNLGEEGSPYATL